MVVTALIRYAASAFALAGFAASQAVWAAPAENKDAIAADRAQATLRSMTVEEKTVLTHGLLAMPFLPGADQLPADAVPGAGYIAGIPRLGIPSLRESDASLGVAWIKGIRHDGATALPSGLAMASTWNPDLIEAGGRVIGGEARALGFNVLLGGGVNLVREPRNGRNFEYLGEDPLLAGQLVGHAIRGIQSNGIIATIKHFAFNAQETGRRYIDARIGRDQAVESDLLAFKLGIEIGNPGAVMCAYNKVNGDPACASRWLLDEVLKRRWGYRGFTMSDWGAVPGVEAALAGLDQQSGQQMDPRLYFGDELGLRAKSVPAYAARLDDMNRRVLWSIHRFLLDRPATSAPIDNAAGKRMARDIAEQGIVLLKNSGGLLPIAVGARSIVLIGGYADRGVLSGAGSSQVQSRDGPAVAVERLPDGPLSSFMSEQYHRSSPLKAIMAAAPDARVTWQSGAYPSAAAAAAARADVAIVFATQWTGEGWDVPDLSLPDGQDDVIAQVAAANRNTIVVVESGGPVMMPWLDKVGAVIEAWYPGAAGGEAIASVLFGKVNPSGRLPVTFPASLSQLPRPRLGGAENPLDIGGQAPYPGAVLVADYAIEGSDVGYRWFGRTGQKPLFPFGYGLSYTSFVQEALKVDGVSARFTIRNTGPREGADVGQVYLVSRNGKPLRRLVGYRRVSLQPGEARTIEVPIDPRLLADASGENWTIAGGKYGFALGKSAEELGPVVEVAVPRRRWKQ